MGSEATSAERSAEASELRVFWNRFLFRGFIFGSSLTAVTLDRILRRPGVTWAYAQFQSRLMCRALGVEVSVRGAERLGDGPYVFTPNHRSHFDIAALLGYLPGANRFAAKKELFSEPVLGLVMKTMGMIPVDRGDPTESIRRLNEREDEQSSIIIFPEGTRNLGTGLLPFKKGAFVAAIQLGVPVVPVVLKGTGEVMPARSYLSIYPGKVELVVLEPVPTDGLTYEDRTRLLETVRERMLEELAR